MVSVRVRDSVYAMAKRRADERRVTVAEWVKLVIEQHSADSLDAVVPDSQQRGFVFYVGKRGGCFVWGCYRGEQ